MNVPIALIVLFFTVLFFGIALVLFTSGIRAASKHQGGVIRIVLGSLCLVALWLIGGVWLSQFMLHYDFPDTGRPVSPRDLRPEHWVGRWVLKDDVRTPDRRHFHRVPCTFHAPSGEVSAVTLFADGSASATNWVLVTWDTKEVFRFPELHGRWTYQYNTNSDFATIDAYWTPPEGGFPQDYSTWQEVYCWDPIKFSSLGFGHLRAERYDPAHHCIEYLVLDEPWNRD